MAFNRPQAGVIRVDGRDLSRLKLRDYRRQLGIVLQDNFLFDGTVADNIGFSKPGATRAEIEAAGSIAHCEEFVGGFEKGYDTVVGERGVKLSGGQRQRIAIARAILADPRILILDEATSSLDSESEALIQDGLRALRHGRTTFVIAHRLSTIRSADQILVLEHGEIVERGTHSELLALDGRYRQLYDKQYNFEQDRFINPGEDFTPEPEKERARAGAQPGTVTAFAKARRRGTRIAKDRLYLVPSRLRDRRDVAVSHGRVFPSLVSNGPYRSGRRSLKNPIPARNARASSRLSGATRTVSSVRPASARISPA